MMVMAISGAAVVPLLYGRLADISTPLVAYWIVIPIYCYILYYATYGRISRQGEDSGVMLLIATNDLYLWETARILPANLLQRSRLLISMG